MKIRAVIVDDEELACEELTYLLKDFPEVEERMRCSAAGSMGMSYEIADAHVEDMNAEVWMLTRATFTGAAILLREKAAYRNTSFQLTAKRCRGIAARRSPVADRPRSLDGRNICQIEKGKEARWR